MNKKIKNFFLFSFLVITGIHLINRLSTSIYTSKNLLTNSKNQYYEWRFGKVRFIKKGNGTPLLLIHDLDPGSSSYEFNKLIDSLSKKHEVYVLDLLGYGLSDKPNITYTNYLYVQLITDFIKNIISKKTNILSSGDSSSFILHAIHNEPELFQNCILINPQSVSNANKIPTKQRKILKFLFDLPLFGTLLYNAVSNKKSLGILFQNEYFYNGGMIEDSFILSYLEAAHIPDHRAKFSYSSNIGGYMNNGISHCLKEINHNISIIYGSEYKNHEKQLIQFKELNSSIESFVVKKTKKLPHLESSGEILSIINLIL